MISVVYYTVSIVWQTITTTTTTTIWVKKRIHTIPKQWNEWIVFLFQLRCFETHYNTVRTQLTSLLLYWKPSPPPPPPTAHRLFIHGPIHLHVHTYGSKYVNASIYFPVSWYLSFMVHGLWFLFLLWVVSFVRLFIRSWLYYLYNHVSSLFQFSNLLCTDHT